MMNDAACDPALSVLDTTTSRSAWVVDRGETQRNAVDARCGLLEGEAMPVLENDRTTREFGRELVAEKVTNSLRLAARALVCNDDDPRLAPAGIEMNRGSGVVLLQKDDEIARVRATPVARVAALGGFLISREHETIEPLWLEDASKARRKSRHVQGAAVGWVVVVVVDRRAGEGGEGSECDDPRKQLHSSDRGR